MSGIGVMAKHTSLPNWGYGFKSRMLLQYVAVVQPAEYRLARSKVAGSNPVCHSNSLQGIITTIEYLLMLLIQLGAEGFTTCRGAMDFSVSILRDTLGEELPYASDDMREGRNCQQKSRGTVR